MANRTVTRTHVASIHNQRQVRDDLNSLKFAVLRNLRFLMGCTRASLS